MLGNGNIRGEHLLWLTPVTFTWLATFTAPVQVFVFFYHATYYVMSYTEVTASLILCCIIPYFLHRKLRAVNYRSTSVSWMHISSSVAIMLTIMFIYTYTPPIDKEWRYFPILRPNYIRWRMFNDIAIVLFQAFLLIQVSFCIYSLKIISITRRINRAHNSHPFVLEEMNVAEKDQQLILEN